MYISLRQWLNFKLSGITCLVGKKMFLNFYLRVHWLSEYDYICIILDAIVSMISHQTLLVLNNIHCTSLRCGVLNFWCFFPTCPFSSKIPTLHQQLKKYPPEILHTQNDAVSMHFSRPMICWYLPSLVLTNRP